MPEELIDCRHYILSERWEKFIKRYEELLKDWWYPINWMFCATQSNIGTTFHIFMEKCPVENVIEDNVVDTSIEESALNIKIMSGYEDDKHDEKDFNIDEVTWTCE